MASASGQVETMEAQPRRELGAPVPVATPRDLTHVLREDVELIDLRARNLSERELYAVAEAVPKCSKLQTLNLEWNSMGRFPRAVTAVVEAVAASRSLRHADLRNTGLGAVAAPALRRLLTGNRSLQTLDLRWNDLGSTGVGQVVAGLQYNPTVRRVFLMGNGATPEMLKQADEICSRNIEEGRTVPLPPYDPAAEAKLRLAETDARESSRKAAKWHGTSISLEAALANAQARIGRLMAVVDAHDAAMLEVTTKMATLGAELKSVRASSAKQIEVHQAEAVRARREAQEVFEAKQAEALASRQLEHQLRAAIGVAARRHKALEGELAAALRRTSAARAEADSAIHHAERIAASKADLETALRGEMETSREEAQRRADRMHEAFEAQLAGLRGKLRDELDRSGELQVRVDALTQQVHDAAVAKDAAVADARRQVAAEWQTKLDAETAHLRSRLRGAETDRDLATSALSAARDAHAGEVERLTGTAEAYRARAEGAEAASEGLRSDLSALQTQRGALIREVGELKGSVTRLHAAKEAMVEELTFLRHKVATAESERAAALAAQRRELQAAMSRREARIVSLKQQIISSRVAMDSLLTETGRRLHSLHTDAVSQLKAQVVAHEAMLDVEDSGAFDSMDPHVAAALLSDTPPRATGGLPLGSPPTAPTPAEVTEEMRMYHRAMAAQGVGAASPASPGSPSGADGGHPGLHSHTSHKPLMTLEAIMAAGGGSPQSPAQPTTGGSPLQGGGTTGFGQWTTRPGPGTGSVATSVTPESDGDSFDLDDAED